VIAKQSKVSAKVRVKVRDKVKVRIRVSVKVRIGIVQLNFLKFVFYVCK
jgi:hypothetical protein